MKPKAYEGSLLAGRLVEFLEPGFVQCPEQVQEKIQKWQGTVTACNFLAAKINNNNNKLGICNNL